jgi:hypothetical protein
MSGWAQLLFYQFTCTIPIWTALYEAIWTLPGKPGWGALCIVHRFPGAPRLGAEGISAFEALMSFYWPAVNQCIQDQLLSAERHNVTTGLVAFD